MKFVRSIVTPEFQEARTMECEARDLTQSQLDQLVEFYCQQPEDDFDPTIPPGESSAKDRQH